MRNFILGFLIGIIALLIIKNDKSKLWKKITNDNIKNILDNKLCNIKKEPYKYGFFIALIFALIPIFILLFYFIGDCGIVAIYTSLSVDGALGFYGSFLAFLGTVSLGALALLQNNRFKKENEKIQDELKELNKQSNDISKNILQLEKAKFLSMINVGYLTLLNPIHSETNCPIYDLRGNDYTQANEYIIEMDIINNSAFPIVEISMSIRYNFLVEKTLGSTKKINDSSIYIKEHSKARIALRVMTVKQGVFNTDHEYIDINFRFTNIFDFTLKSTVFIQIKNGVLSEQDYRMAKIIDVRSINADNQNIDNLK